MAKEGECMPTNCSQTALASWRFKEPIPRPGERSILFCASAALVVLAVPRRYGKSIYAHSDVLLIIRPSVVHTSSRKSRRDGLAVRASFVAMPRCRARQLVASWSPWRSMRRDELFISRQSTCPMTTRYEQRTESDTRCEYAAGYVRNGTSRILRLIRVATMDTQQMQSHTHTLGAKVPSTG